MKFVLSRQSCQVIRVFLFSTLIGQLYTSKLQEMLVVFMGFRILYSVISNIDRDLLEKYEQIYGLIEKND